MPETKGTVDAIEQWEAYPKELVKLGMAELVHDSTKNIDPLFEQSDEDSLDYVRTYHLFVGSGINMLRVEWRFHYDKRPGAKSSLRIRKKGLRALLGSMTVMNVINKLNIEITGNNGYDIDKLKLIMEEAVKIVEARKLKNKDELFPKKEVFNG